MRKYRLQILALSVIIAIVIGIRLSGAHRYLSVENLKEHRYVLEQFISERYGVSVLIYIITYIALVTFSIPGATVLTLSGGFFFGILPGVLYTIVGATLGAALAFLFSRYVLGNVIQDKYGQQLANFNRELGENGHLYLLAVRLIPVLPFFLINLLSGLTKIPLKTFVWTTAVGIIPGSFVYIYAGSQLGTISTAGDLFRGRILTAFLLLAALVLIPLGVKKIRAHRAR